MQNQSLGQVFVRIAQEDKAMKAIIQVLELKVGPLANLPTSSKNSIVASIIELYNSLQNKVDAQYVTDQKVALKSEILGGAAEAVDTLKELADLWATQNADLADLLTLIGSKVSFITAQELTSEQKAIVLQNMGAVAIATYDALEQRVSTAEGAITDLQTALANPNYGVLGEVLQTQEVEAKTVRVDVDQEFSETEQAQGRDNLGLASATAFQQLSESTQGVEDTTDYLSLYLDAYHASDEAPAPADVTFLLANFGEYDLSILDSTGNTTATLNGWVYSSGTPTNEPVEVTGNRMRVDAPGRDWASAVEGDVVLWVKIADDPNPYAHRTVYLELDTLVGSVATFWIQPTLSGELVSFKDS